MTALDTLSLLSRHQTTQVLRACGDPQLGLLPYSMRDLCHTGSFVPEDAAIPFVPQWPHDEHEVKSLARRFGQTSSRDCLGVEQTYVPSWDALLQLYRGENRPPDLFGEWAKH